MRGQTTASISRVSRPAPSPDARIVRACRPNVLITGSQATIDVLMASLRPSLKRPLNYWSPNSPLPAPAAVATLVIGDVATLSFEQQRALMSWLDGATRGSTQVVSTSVIELFPLVQRGMFLAALFYRLNTVRLDPPIPVG